MWFYCCITTAALFGAAPETTEQQRFDFESVQMGSQFRVILYAGDRQSANNAAKAAFDRVAELNRLLSDYDGESELNRLCRVSGTSGPVEVSRDLFTVLEESQRVGRLSDGAFDVTVGPYVRLWRRARRRGELPDADKLADARTRVGPSLLKLDPAKRTVELTQPRMQLDLGGVAKGYAADAALAVLVERGFPHALVAASGDVRAGLPPPGEKGWSVEVEEMKGENGIVNVCTRRKIWLSESAVSTSGDAFQFVEIAGKRYSHVVDPTTGLGLLGRRRVTVAAPKGVQADSLSSAVYVMGVERGLALIETLPETAALFAWIDDSGRVQVQASKRWPKWETPPSADGRPQ